MRVLFLRYRGTGRPGDILDLPEHVAQRFILEGAAEEYKEEAIQTASLGSSARERKKRTRKKVAHVR